MPTLTRLGRFSEGTRCGAAIPEFETALVTLTSMAVQPPKVTSTPPARVARMGISPAVLFAGAARRNSFTPAGTIWDASRRAVSAGHFAPSRPHPLRHSFADTLPHFPRPGATIGHRRPRDVHHRRDADRPQGSNFRLPPPTDLHPAPSEAPKAPYPRETQ